MIKEIADPMFKTMLPGPLASLHFTKVDLGAVPIKFSHAIATKTENAGISLDLNVDWEGNCDIELDGDMIPTLVSLSLYGHLSPDAISLNSRFLGSRKSQASGQAVDLAVPSDERHPAGMLRTPSPQCGSSLAYD